MICLVTGSSRGLGRSIALALGRKEHSVAVHYKSHIQEAEETASIIGDAIIVNGDVGVCDHVHDMINRVLDKWGRLDVLINNAGITKESLLVRTSEQDFMEVINTNLKGPFHLIKAAGKQMMKQRNGHIVNISSYAGIKGKQGLIAYASSKAALSALTRSAAIEMGKYNIMVNAVLPGYMMTDMGVKSKEEAQKKALQESILNTYSNPDQVADFICNLLTSTGITGQIFNLDSRIM